MTKAELSINVDSSALDEVIGATKELIAATERAEKAIARLKQTGIPITVEDRHVDAGFDKMMDTAVKGEVQRTLRESAMRTHDETEAIIKRGARTTDHQFKL